MNCRTSKKTSHCCGCSTREFSIDCLASPEFDAQIIDRELKKLVKRGASILGMEFVQKPAGLEFLNRLLANFEYSYQKQESLLALKRFIENENKARKDAV
jgi:hypothetical protein